MQEAKSSVTLNNDFNYDWNDYHTIASNKDKIDALNTYINQTLANLDSLSEEERQAFGQLCYKLATFYNHSKRAPDSAIEKLNIAKQILTDEKTLFWIKNHIAFSFQQKQALNKKNQNHSNAAAFGDTALTYCNDVIQKQSADFENDIESVKIVAFAYCVRALSEYENSQLEDAIKSFRYALNLYETHTLLDDQYARAKNRYAQFLEDVDLDQAHTVFSELNQYWLKKQEEANLRGDVNPYEGRFHDAYGKFLEKRFPDTPDVAIAEFQKAHKILCITEGEQAPYTRDVNKKISELKGKQIQEAFNTILESTLNNLMSLPLHLRELTLESFCTLILRAIVPMSGKTVQQHTDADQEFLKQLSTALNKPNPLNNGTDPRYVYMFAREATSAGIIPTCIINGRIHIGLVCNKRNLNMYNWSAGYTDTFPPGWTGKLLDYPNQDIYYDRKKIKDSATKTALELLAEANGDWTKVNFDPARFAEGFKRDGVILPEKDGKLPGTDINSDHTGKRELLEEMGINLDDYPDKKVFECSKDNTMGISQGDAPGQTGNRSHQSLALLGKLKELPKIKPGDDVAIADWVDVSEIVRKSPTEYFANGKELCIYMLRGLEIGLNNLWNHLIEEASTYKSPSTSQTFTRFSNPQNIIAELIRFCDMNNIQTKGTRIETFIKYFSEDANTSLKTRIGKEAQDVLNCLLQTAEYLTKSNLKPETFVSDMDNILSCLDAPAQAKVFSLSPKMTKFQPAHSTQTQTTSVTPSSESRSIALTPELFSGCKN